MQRSNKKQGFRQLADMALFLTARLDYPLQYAGSRLRFFIC